MQGHGTATIHDLSPDTSYAQHEGSGGGQEEHQELFHIRAATVHIGQCGGRVDPGRIE